MLCSPRRAWLLALLLPATSAHGLDQAQARGAVEAGHILPLATLRATVERQYVGQVVDTSLDRDGGRWLYRFKLLPPSGRLYWLDIDAASGALLAARGTVQERP